jgi:ArsR family transcriptional regulator, lead/cadmium/zinc/bismuth-responsive transcriptional repressor
VETGWSLKSNEEMCGVREAAEQRFPMILNNEELEGSAAFFKGLADETRLKIISLLWLDDLCMCEIVAALDGASSTISHHLKIMEKGGVIESRRDGKFTIYRVNKQKLTPVFPLLNK